MGPTPLETALDYETAARVQQARTDLPPGYIAAHRWDLFRAPGPVGAPPLPSGATLIACADPPPEYYLFLQGTVGRDWLWWSWAERGEAAIAEKFTSPDNDLTVAFIDGAPQGFFELQRAGAPNKRDWLAGAEAVELEYFGLMPWAIGRGLGPALLGAAIAAGGGETRAMTVNTCSFDHPKALRMYQRAGFRVYRESVEVEPDPRLSGVLPRDAAPHVPLARGAP